MTSVRGEKKNGGKAAITPNLKMRNSKHSGEKGSHHHICPAASGAGPETF